MQHRSANLPLPNRIYNSTLVSTQRRGTSGTSSLSGTSSYAAGGKQHTTDRNTHSQWHRSADRPPSRVNITRPHANTIATRVTIVHTIKRLAPLTAPGIVTRIPIEHVYLPRAALLTTALIGQSACSNYMRPGSHSPTGSIQKG